MKSHRTERPNRLQSFVSLVRRHRTARQFSAFLLVGILNTLFGYSVFAVLYLVGLPYRAAIALATAAGVIFNYFTTGRFVFAGSGVGIFVRFVLAYFVICTFNIVLVDASTFWQVNTLLAQALALTVVVPLSFVINKWFVFRSRP